MTNLFYDSEFTGLQQDTSLISLALISECGKTFYAEFNDFNYQQVDDWLQENVINHCRWIADKPTPFVQQQENQTLCYGDRQYIKNALQTWLTQFDAIQIWADCPAWDWVLFCQLFGGALHIPGNIHYMVADLSTALRLKGIDPDINREQFAAMQPHQDNQKHNALWDARVLQACYQKLKLD
ncbi:3'-5' exoribonuclease domain-containing protein [Bacterioplanoides sp.]|uniref:3'-5' exoribonuclease domain-containing protein n=1 Tax=Bacterioplanoides sp. TaxID=2066072 RepID=UPI003B59DFEA